MTDFVTPVGRLVQGSPIMQQQRDVDTNQPKTNPDGSPEMGVFFALAFPKVLPNGMPNTEFDTFLATLKQTAAAAWPALFPQGPLGQCVNPRFSWKYQDGDGYDQSGKSVADKPGFKGHHIIKFSTSYPVRCYYEGKFAQHEEIQQPDTIIKRGFWCRVVGEAKSNNATGTQVPGIAVYPKLLSFVERGEEIVSGPDAQAAFGGAAVGWRPPASASPVPMPGAGVPAGLPPTPVGVPTPTLAPPAPVPVMAPPPPAAPQFVISPALAAQGITIEALLAQGWTHDTLVQHGHATRVG